MRENPLRGLFFALALLSALPFWTVRYLPTLDGPTHTYNAWVLRQMGNVEQYPLFHQHYEVNARPFPNWTGHAVMAALMFAVPPLVAEKLLVSGYLLLFLGGLWYLVGAVRPTERWLAFLAFPFAWNQMFQFGFYNFALSLALFPWILGCWWRNREAPGLRFAVQINLLLWLCYFSHILSFVLALTAIGFLWLATWRRETWRRHLRHVLLLLPQVALPVWFFLQKTGAEIPAAWSGRRLARYFLNLQTLVTLSDGQRWIAQGIAGLFLVALLLSLWRKARNRALFEREDVFLLLALLGVVLYALSPQGLAGGTVLKPRLSLYPWLLLIPWFSLGLGRTATRATVAVLAAAILCHLAYMTHLYRASGAEVERFLTALRPVRPNTRLLPVLFRTPRPTPFLNHAAGYTALEKGLIDWDNYEAKYSFFPVRFRRSVVYPEVVRLALAPQDLRPKGDVDLIDAVYTWKMPPGHALRKRLRRHYEQVSGHDGGELYEARSHSPTSGRPRP